MGNTMNPVIIFVTLLVAFVIWSGGIWYVIHQVRAPNG